MTLFFKSKNHKKGKFMNNRAFHEKFQVAELNSDANYLSGVSSLGCGYDVFGEYATPISITFPLFDWTKVPTRAVTFYKGKVIPNIVSAVQLETSNYKEISGSSIEEYIKNLNTYTKLEGSYSFYSGSVSVGYNASEYRNAKNEFSLIQQDIAKWALKFTPETALNYIKDDVKNDIADMDPIQLFKRYGTHFLSAIVIGGKSMMTSATNQVDYQSEYGIDLTAKLAYESLTFQISAENKTKYSQEISTFESRSNTEVRTYGGSAEKGGTNILKEGGFQEWQDSVGDNPTFVDFDNDNALTPIWELCEDQKRKEALIHAYATFAKGKTSECLNVFSANSITELRVISGDSSVIQPPTGYIKDDFDLNKGAGGKFIYVCYKEDSTLDIKAEKLDVITDITTISGDSPDIQAPDGYIKIGQDLNEGARGKYIYLCYKKGEYSETDSIKDIMVIGSSQPQIYPPIGFERINQDLNQGAGGLYIYMCYSRTL
ncbi:hypothetical protein TW85_19220 [Marinomonas sp. S3726]|uniref:MAC/perforin domain-containing protein n=1 Tax=Marinomonas sp. S3726 TaxID=579484 RepID=UPI0005FA8749|nr:MAC/perforin domain-containing protein [Marinomonas sp. S3726]KJZ10850.1 hypothetical protein TW85_19220 [Marinomonas sp. S3726]